jgi:hypothetical protein
MMKKIKKFSKLPIVDRSKLEPYTDAIKDAWERGYGYSAIQRALLCEPGMEIDVPMTTLKNFIDVRVRRGLFARQNSKIPTTLGRVSRPKPKKDVGEAANSSVHTPDLQSNSAAEPPWPAHCVDLKEVKKIAHREGFPMQENGEIDFASITVPTEEAPESLQFRRFLLAISLRKGWRLDADRHSRSVIEQITTEAHNLIAAAKLERTRRK